jgi:hypothetical protein
MRRERDGRERNIGMKEVFSLSPSAFGLFLVTLYLLMEYC